MIDNSTKLTRRTVLRRGAISAGAISVGIAGFSGTSLASDCPRTPGFWANHDWCDVPASDTYSVAELISETTDQFSGGCTENGPEGVFCLVSVCKDMDGWQSFLTGPTRGDKAIIMARHLLATRLNFWRRPRPTNDPDCIGKTLDLSAYGLGEMTIAEVEDMASKWLAHSAWTSNNGSQRSWTVRVGGTWMDGEPLKDVLDAFNNGRLNLDGCNC